MPLSWTPTIQSIVVYLEDLLLWIPAACTDSSFTLLMTTELTIGVGFNNEPRAA